jgi:hypothetical protein
MQGDSELDMTPKLPEYMAQAGSPDILQYSSD